MRIQANGLNFNVWVDGAPVAPPVLLLHGWPDSSQIWTGQVAALIGAGFRTIAPDLRGYGGSDKPDGVQNYTFKNIMQDIIGILDNLKVDRFYLVGHDWGASLAWYLAYHLPTRVIKLVVMSTGNFGCFFAGPAGDRQRQASWYMLAFMRPEAEKCLSADNWAAFRRFLGHCKPDQLEEYVHRLSKPGALTASLNWYRANMRVESFLASSPFELPQLEVPVMGIWGSRDGACLEPQMKNSGRFVKEGLWRYERVDGAGHWVTIDAPDRINALLLGFLGAPVQPSAKL
eukprot:jgi/Botrbrau1/7421/Bobra.0112s0020.1